MVYPGRFGVEKVQEYWEGRRREEKLEELKKNQKNKEELFLHFGPWQNNWEVLPILRAYSTWCLVCGQMEAA